MKTTESDRKEYKSNKESGVVYDRNEPGKYRGTNIIMMYLRKRKPGEKSAYSKEVAPGWVVDFDSEDKPIEIEVLDTSGFPQAILDLLPPEFIEVEE